MPQQAGHVQLWLQIVMQSTSFRRLQQTFAEKQRQNAVCAANLDRCKALFDDAKTFSQAFKLLICVKYKCGPGGPGFDLTSKVVTDEVTGVKRYRDGYKAVLGQIADEREQHGVPHRLHACNVPGCAGLTPGSGAKTACICDGVMVRLHALAPACCLLLLNLTSKCHELNTALRCKWAACA